MNSIFKILKKPNKTCESKGATKSVKFTDASFPASDESLCIDSNKKPKEIADVKWLRPDELKTNPRLPFLFKNDSNSQWVTFDMPDYFDINQGILGNCWLISALIVIIERPKLLKRIINSREKDSCYEVRLCKNGEWQTVIIDDLFPCDQNGNLIYSHANRKQLWVPLIEKAMAKLNGSYEILNGGQSIELMSSLTGFPCFSICLDDNEEKIDLDLIWVKLLSMKEAGYILTASTNRRNISENMLKVKGLEPKHIYSVQKVELVNGNQCILLRNPWGNNTGKFN